MSNIIIEGMKMETFEALLKMIVEETFVEKLSKKQCLPQNEPNKYLTRKEAAKKLTLSLPTLARYTQSGLIPSRRVGSRVLYREQEIEEALKNVSSQKFKA